MTPELRDAAIGYTAGAYDAMAPFYDAFTGHHDVDHWTRQLEALAHRHGLSGRSMLDVGCGTGKSFEPFLARGWSVTACDVSAGMLEIAAGRAAGRVRLERHDVRQLPRLGRFDLILVLDDVLNYVLDRAELVGAFARLRANAAANGLLVFDVNCLATYRGFFAESLSVDTPSGALLWQGMESSRFATGRLARGRFSTQTPDGPVEALHVQRHYPVTDIGAALCAAGWTLEGVYGQGLDGIPVEDLDEEVHTKAIFVAVPAVPQ